MRPTDSGPAHARHDGAPVFRPTDTAAPPAWPAGDVLTRRPRRPAIPSPEPEVPRARTAADAPAWPARHRPAALGLPLSRGRAQAPPSFLREPIVGQDVPAPPRRPRHAAPDMLADTVPMAAPVAAPRHSGDETSGPPASAVVYALPETPATGLRKFDLGTVPASVTPPRTWRKAAWFAVGTSAAVALGLTVATAELMGRQVGDGAMIDALPAYPTGPLTLTELPHAVPTSHAPATGEPAKPRATPDSSDAARPPSQDSAPRDTVAGGTTGEEPVSPTEQPSALTTTTAPTTPREPVRHTVGAAPVLATDPAKMGDRTEEYFELVTTDPAAAHALTSGGMAREGAEGIEARYGGVERVEVQEITIDRGQATTTSKVKVVHEDGTETIEHRRLTFTGGSDPKITDEAVTA